jgi:integrase
MAAEEFRRAVQAAAAKSPFIFPSAEHPNRASMTPMAVTRAMARLVTELNIAKVSPHDLRRTVATGFQRLGVRFEVTEAVLNHVSGSRGGIAGIYQQHDWADEKRAALDAWSDHLLALVRPAVVPERELEAEAV